MDTQRREGSSVTVLTREQLDRHMEAWRLYYHENRSTAVIGAHFGVSPRSVSNWIKALGGELRGGKSAESKAIQRDNNEALQYDKRLAALPPGMTLCLECGIICAEDETGLCPEHRDGVERQDEDTAWLALGETWLQRNFVAVPGTWRSTGHGYEEVQ